MLTPFDIARRAVGAVEVVAGALRTTDHLDDVLEDRTGRLERRLMGLDATTESLKPLLDANREAVEGQGPRFERMLRELEGAHREIAVLREQVEEIRRIVEPLRGTTERVARINQRLPGR